MTYAAFNLAVPAGDTEYDTVDPVETVIRITKAGEPKRVIAYRCLDNAGEYSEEHAAELLFNNKNELLKWFRKRHIQVTQIEDQAELPW